MQYLHEKRPLPVSSMSALTLFNILEKDFDGQFPPLADFKSLAEKHLECLLPGSKHSKHYYNYLVKFFKTFSIAPDVYPEVQIIGGIKKCSPEEDEEDDEEEEELTNEERKLKRIKLGIDVDSQNQSDNGENNDDDDNCWWTGGQEEMTGSRAGNHTSDYNVSGDDQVDGSGDDQVDGNVCNQDDNR